MGDVLVYPDCTSRQGPSRLLAYARSLADRLGGEVVTVDIAGSGATGLEAADVILRVSHPALLPYVADAHARLLASLVAERKPALLLLENTTVGLDLAAVAALTADMPLVTYCSHVDVVDGGLRTVSEVYGGQLLAEAETALPAVVAVNPAALPEDPAPAGRGAIEEVQAPSTLDTLRMRFSQAVEPEPGGIDITKSERLVCVGRGIGDAESVEVGVQLASALNADLAASRPVVDAGWVPKSQQVGKSGLRVEPRLYLMLGVSGAPEHLEGMSRAGLIIAINTDPAAPIFNVAHYGAVSDLFDVAEKLTQLVEGSAP